MDGRMIHAEKKKDGQVAGLSADIYRVPATLRRLGHGNRCVREAGQAVSGSAVTKAGGTRGDRDEQ
jgi:hypothetical protein